MNIEIVGKTFIIISVCVDMEAVYKDDMDHGKEI
jgi:hypothetical protein